MATIADLKRVAEVEFSDIVKDPRNLLDNFEIPDYWGIGKLVSKGFDMVKIIGEENI